jgi:1,4-dihydroxy-2-naphthoate octaprenyltransferase
MPFILGSLMAARYGHFNVQVFFLGCAAVLLIMLATNLNGEVYDIKEDTLSLQFGKNKFSGGSGVLADKQMPARYLKRVSLLAATLALLIGVVLQYVYATGPFTLALGITGIIAGFFYSKPPLRWVTRGMGELMIAYCYGWLPVAAAFYLQAHYIHTLVHWVAIPVAASIFNVILINEFPDYDADAVAGKKNLLVRLGKLRASLLYAFCVVLLSVMFYNSIIEGVAFRAIFYFIPFFIIAFSNMIVVLRGKFNSHRTLERVCGLTIVVNLGITLAYTLSFL